MHAVYAGKDLLRVDGDVYLVELTFAIATVAAVVAFDASSEVADDECPETFRGVAVCVHLIQAAHFERFAVRVICGDVDKIFLRHDVCPGV